MVSLIDVIVYIQKRKTRSITHLTHPTKNEWPTLLAALCARVQGSIEKQKTKIELALSS